MRHRALLIRLMVMLLICILSFAIRLFPAFRYEVMIHEFDPHFNFRVTTNLVERGLDLGFLHWFDDTVWYPAGRDIARTTFPGIMFTAAAMHQLFHAMTLPFSLREICALTGPIFAVLTAISSYILGAETTTPLGGLMAAFLTSILPGFISRSVLGSYDNEAVSIFALVFTFAMWVKAVNKNSILYTLASSLGYFYMVASWGGYVYIINLVPIHVLALMVFGRFTRRVYRVYSVWYAVGTLLSLTVPFVGLRPVQSVEHLGAFGVFGLCQLWVFIQFFHGLSGDRKHFLQLFWRLIALLLVLAGVAAALFMVAFASGSWAARFHALLNPLKSGSGSPLVASVAEHQPTAWGHLWMDLESVIVLAPVGLLFLWRRPTDAAIFIFVFVATSAYFTSVMVRLVLVATPVYAQLGAVAVTALLDALLPIVIAGPRKFKRWSQSLSSPFWAARAMSHAGGGSSHSTGKSQQSIRMLAGAVLGLLLLLLLHVSSHSAQTANVAYSSPLIVGGGPMGLHDEYREMYYWMHQNTPRTSRIMSWWDYGYHVSSMADRPNLVDNNTNNQTQIANVGRMFMQPEHIALDWMRHFGVDYAFALTDQLGGPNSDDLGKSYWLIRISGETFPGEGIVLDEYIDQSRGVVSDASAPPHFRQSMLYHILFNRWSDLLGQAKLPPNAPAKHMTVNTAAMSPLMHISEAYATEYHYLRTFRVRMPGELARSYAV